MRRGNFIIIREQIAATDIAFWLGKFSEFSVV
jgi:hypothetical protein